eukprot:4938493-Alexandrium_andersonii.AAC.1
MIGVQKTSFWVSLIVADRQRNCVRFSTAAARLSACALGAARAASLASARPLVCSPSRWAGRRCLAWPRGASQA